eukprot:SAG31_NODE_110_length_24476_cov_9.909654_5_plen_205_part_00
MRRPPRRAPRSCVAIIINQRAARPRGALHAVTMMAARLKLISEHLHAMASWHEASKKSRVGSATGEDAARDTVSSASASAAAADSANHSATSVSIRPCRVAIIGLGRQGSTICSEQPAGSPPFSIAGACHASSKLELVAGCDLLPAKREAFTQLWGCKDVYAVRCSGLEFGTPPDYLCFLILPVPLFWIRDDAGLCADDHVCEA